MFTWSVTERSVGRTILFCMAPTLTIRAARHSSGCASDFSEYPASSTSFSLAKSTADESRSRGLKYRDIHSNSDDAKTLSLLVALNYYFVITRPSGSLIGTFRTLVGSFGVGEVFEYIFSHCAALRTPHRALQFHNPHPLQFH